MTLPSPKRMIDRLVDHAFAPQPLVEPQLGHQVDGALLQHAGAHAILHIGAAARLEHHAVDAFAIEQCDEKQPRGARADDGDLCVHRSSLASRHLVRPHGDFQVQFGVDRRDNSGSQPLERLAHPWHTAIGSCMPGRQMTAIATEEKRRFAFAFAALVGGAVAMGASVLFVRWADVGPYASAFWRVFLALPFLFVWMRLENRSAARPSLDRAVLLAGLLFTGDLFFWHLAILGTTVANATFLATTAPIWVALGAWLLLVGDGRRTAH